MYIVAGIIVVIVVFLSVGYVKSPPNTATIISGPGKHPRVLIGKAGFKIPFLERVDRMGIGQIDIDIETEDYIPTKDFINIQVDAIAQVAVDISSENIEIAMRNFLNKSSDEVRNTITKSLQGNLREIIGTMELKDICQNKAEFHHLSRNLLPFPRPGCPVWSLSVLQNAAPGASLLQSPSYRCGHQHR